MIERDKFRPSHKHFVDSSSVYKMVSELADQLHSVQRAIAAVRGEQSDFKAEYLEGMSEVKRALQELRSNKVWLPRERI